MANLVVFDEKGVRIHHVDNVADVKKYMKEHGLAGKDHLIDPVYPPGVPPHLWKLHEGKIVLDVREKPKKSFKAFLARIFKKVS